MHFKHLWSQVNNNFEIIIINKFDVMFCVVQFFSKGWRTQKSDPKWIHIVDDTVSGHEKSQYRTQLSSAVFGVHGISRVNKPC